MRTGPTKSEQIEETLLELVRAGDVAAVRSFLEKTGPLRSMGAALGFACRYIGPDMAKLLMEQGASFECDRDPVLEIGKGFGKGEILAPYVYLLRERADEHLLKFDMSYTLVSQDDYDKTLALLVRAGKSVGFSPSELLFCAVLQDEQQVVSSLAAAGITQLLGYPRHVMADGPVNGQDPRQKEYMRDFIEAFLIARDQTQKLCRQMSQIVGGRVRLRRFDITDEVFAGDFAPERALCAVQYTTLADTYGRKNLLLRCIEGGFDDALDWALQHKWVTGWKVYEELTEAARSKNASESTLACLLKYKDLCASSREKAEARARNMNPFSAQAMHKIWSSRTLEDDTLEIISYKGGGVIDGKLAVPAQIGTKKVTQITSSAFDPRMAANDQIGEARSAVMWLELPGTIREVPEAFMAGAESLERVDIGEGTTVIGQSAFLRCGNLEEVTMPSTLTTVGRRAFAFCTQLRQLSAVSPNASIGGNAFVGCNDLPDSDGIIVVGRYAVSAQEHALFPAYEVPSDICLEPECLWRMPVLTYRRQTDEKCAPAADFADLKVGETVTLGRFPQNGDLRPEPLSWICLESAAKSALLITEKIIARLPVHWEADAAWRSCWLRDWLNDPFLNHVFLPQEKKIIQAVQNEDSEDFVFVLNSEETEEYFPMPADRKCWSTAYADLQILQSWHNWKWILRSDSRLADADCCTVVDASGEISVQAASTGLNGRIPYMLRPGTDEQEERCLGIRPAVWIKK